MRKGKNRENEKGAAMVMVLLLSLLLLVASAGLLLEVSMNTANVTDATAEQQAYNAAESGLQSAINVLRGNELPNPLFDTSDPDALVNKIDFRKAVSLSKSNLTDDGSTEARLSRWMNYNYSSTGATVGDRVTLYNDIEYQPRNGYAFTLDITDPDNTGDIISYNDSTPNPFYDTDGSPAGWKSSITIGDPGSTATLTYTAPNPSINNLDVSTGSADTNYGSFTVTTSAAEVFLKDDVRFQIVVNMTAPYTAVTVLRGWIKADTYTSTNPIKFDFDSPIYQIMGSTITLLDVDSDGVFTVKLGETKLVTGNMTQAEPYRVVVRATGYGPRGAKKILEATVQKNFFNGMGAPATLTLIGPSSGAVFEPGSSTNTVYSGDDVVSTMVIPPIGTTNDENLDLVFTKTNGVPPHPFNGSVVGTAANIESEVPYWLENPTNLNTTLQSLKLTAQTSGRYFASGEEPDDYGNNSTGRGITYCDGDCTLGPESGGGILIVTGKLTLKGNFNFKGLIIVTGSGGVERSGGGTGILQGNIVVAAYNPSNLAAGFLPPKYDLSGGGTSDVIYNSSSVANGLVAVSNFVLGVAEK